MIGYKLFRKRKDGSYGPLFINRKLRIEPSVWYEMEDHPTKGYAHRPGWHVCKKPIAPHLKLTKDRVWCVVECHEFSTIKRPEAQGGEWVLASDLRIIREW